MRSVHANATKNSKKCTSSYPFFQHQLHADTAPIDLQMPARHKLAVLTRQERNYTRHIIRTTKSAQRCLILQFAQILLAPALLEPWARIDD